MTGVSFEDLLAGLEAKPTGQQGQYTAKCPAPGHGQGRGDRNNSFSIALGDVVPVVLWCHALCPYEAIVEALQQRDLWPVEVAAQPGAPTNPANLDSGLLERIGKIRAGLRQAEHSRVDRYLSNRGIALRSPQHIAYHPTLWHPFDQTAWPAMVAAVRSVEGHIVGLHRTYLSYREPITKAPVEEPRLTLGPVTGNAIHLSPPAETLLLGEGVETVLSGMELFKLPGWAAISAGNLPKLILPPIVRRVILLVDDDPAGYRAAADAASRLRLEGRQVEAIKPTPTGVNDFNDLLMMQREVS